MFACKIVPEMSGPTMWVRVTHVDDSPKGRQGPSLHFWGASVERNASNLIDGYLEMIRKELESRPPPMHQNMLIDQVFCVLVNQKWHRAQLKQLKLSPIGTLEVYLMDTGATQQVPLAFIRMLDIPGREAELIREWSPIATRFILADIVAGGPNNQWSDLAISVLKCIMENCTWKAVILGYHNDCKGVRLYDHNSQLLVTMLIQKGLGFAAQTYHEALYSTQQMIHQETIDQTPAFLQPAFDSLPSFFSTSRLNNFPPSFAIPAADRGNRSFAYPVNPASVVQSTALNRPLRAYVSNIIPAIGRHEVIVTHVADGPLKFYLVMKSAEPELNNLRQKLQIESMLPRRFIGIPQRGSTCIAVPLAETSFHRGLITNTSANGDQCSIYYGDIGIQEPIDIDSIFEIPDELMEPHLFACRVSLNRVEEVAELNGLKAIFTELVKSNNSLQCEVVNNEQNDQKVDLYDHTGRNLMDILLTIQSNLQTTTPFSAPSSRPASAIPTRVFEVRETQDMK